MLDDFLIRAMIAGIGTAVAAAPLGCFVVWRRLAYFGETIAHAGLLGVALAVLLGANVSIGVLAIAALVAFTIADLPVRAHIPSDTMLGILSHASLSLGLIVLGLIQGFSVNITALLFGDILTVSRQDLIIIWAGAILVIACLAYLWRPLLAATVSPDIAMAEGLAVRRSERLLMLLIAIVVALAVKVVGVLLVTSLLVIPAAAARRFALSPEAMVVIAGACGIAAVLAGLLASAWFDTPSGPSIVVAAFAIFLASLAAPRR